jgi:MFS family permease
MRVIMRSSVDNGLKVPAIRATMLAGVFTGGVGIYVFYALQPYLLNLWGDPTAYGIAGLVAAIVAGAQIAGGLLTPKIRSLFRRRTSALLLLQAVGVGLLALIGLVDSFWMVVVLVVVWALSGSAIRPIRQAYLNAMIPSPQRATILSFDSLMTSAGGIVAQPLLGKSADVWSYQASYLLSAAGSALALPFVLRARQLAVPADTEVAPTDVPSV